MIERIASKEEIRSTISSVRREGRTVGLVPTMGALHAGHLSLVRAARARTDYVVVSIFVNPTQFGPTDDFEKYPRHIGEDLALLGADGVEFAFVPSVDEMYSEGARVTVDPGPLASRWEGAIRPGHFTGVATVVAKLFCIVRPDLAFFGEKDYQQLRIIKRMSADLDLGVGVVGCPIVRDHDGLALSSRNSYLSAEERASASALPRALRAAADEFRAGKRDARTLEAAMRAVTASEPGLELEYAAVVDPASLEPLRLVEGPARVLIAGRVGSTRLIDNRALEFAKPHSNEGRES